MPTYIYQHPNSKKVVEIIQSINDEHVFIDELGTKWNRVFTAPELNTQEKLNESSTSKDFARLTSSQKGKLGDLWDRSAELSEKRKKVYGEDNLKKKYHENWSKKRRGKVHPNSHSN